MKALKPKETRPFFAHLEARRGRRSQVLTRSKIDDSEVETLAGLNYISLSSYMTLWLACRTGHAVDYQ